jgi:hypothetical protein
MRLRIYGFISGHRKNDRRINRCSQVAKENTMPETVVGITAENIGESAGQASRVTSAVADAVHEGAGVVRRAAKQGGMLRRNS